MLSGGTFCPQNEHDFAHPHLGGRAKQKKGVAGLSIQGVVIVRKCKGSFCSSSYGWCSELLHVETARCYEPLQQRTKTAQTCSGIGQIWERRTEAFVSRSVELLWS